VSADAKNENIIAVNEYNLGIVFSALHDACEPSTFESRGNCASIVAEDESLVSESDRFKICGGAVELCFALDYSHFLSAFFVLIFAFSNHFLIVVVYLC
jgi:hypothetical protein